MSDTSQNSSAESAAEIRIVGINTDKTRRAIDSDTNYHVYFTLSQNPTQAWRGIFTGEWKALDITQTRPWPEAVIDGGFLFINCNLQEVQTPYLPLLKKAVAATNKAYQRHVRAEATEQMRREEVWKQERKNVSEMAELLHFE
jgi:hypothetical protein